MTVETPMLMQVCYWLIFNTVSPKRESSRRKRLFGVQRNRLLWKIGREKCAHMHVCSRHTWKSCGLLRIADCILPTAYCRLHIVDMHIVDMHASTGLTDCMQLRYLSRWGIRPIEHGWQRPAAPEETKKRQETRPPTPSLMRSVSQP